MSPLIQCLLQKCGVSGLVSEGAVFAVPGLIVENALGILAVIMRTVSISSAAPCHAMWAPAPIRFMCLLMQSSLFICRLLVSSLRLLQWHFLSFPLKTISQRVKLQVTMLS